MTETKVTQDDTIQRPPEGFGARSDAPRGEDGGLAPQGLGTDRATSDAPECHPRPVIEPELIEEESSFREDDGSQGPAVVSSHAPGIRAADVVRQEGQEPAEEASQDEGASQEAQRREVEGL